MSGHAGLPRTSFRQGKKSFKRAVLKKMIETEEHVVGLKRDMKKEAGELIDKEIESRFSLMDFCLKEIRLFCELLVEKGIATQDEISKKRKETKNGN